MTKDEPTPAIVSPASSLVTGLQAARYRFTFDCLSEVQLKHFPGITLYGALKSLMRPVTCRRERSFCQNQCAFPTACVYGRLLQTVVQRDAGDQTGYTDAPRPFVLHFPDRVRSGYSRGERLCFDVVLLGEATGYLPHLVEALRGLERSGLGDRRREQQGRVRLTAVDVVEPEGTMRLLDGAGRSLRPAPPSRALEGLAFTPTSSATRLELRFVTPLRLMHDGRWVGTEAFELPHLVRALARRIEVLARFHGTHPPEIDPDALVEASEAVRLTERALRWEPLERHSALQEQKHPMDGLLGHVVCEGDLAPLRPLLAAGQLVHVGSKTTMGLGQYETRTLRLEG